MEELVLKDGTSIQKSIKDVTYFPQGTRKYDFLYYLENVGIAQLISKTLFAPIERYRIIKQTWPSFSTTRKPFPTFINFLQRTTCTNQEPGRSKTFLNTGMATAPIASCMSCSWWPSSTSSRISISSGAGIPLLSMKQCLRISWRSYQLPPLLCSWPIRSKPPKYGSVWSFTRKSSGITISRRWMDCGVPSGKMVIIWLRIGLRGLYKGLPIGILTSTLYFYIYYTVGESLMISDIPVLLKSAAVSSLFAVIALYPLDTIKYLTILLRHRLQLDNMGQGVMHLNTRHILRQISN